MYLLFLIVDANGLLAFAFSCLFLYVVIVYGVKASNKEAVGYQRILIKLKIEELKRQGFTSEEIDTIIGKMRG